MDYVACSLQGKLVRITYSVIIATARNIGADCDFRTISVGDVLNFKYNPVQQSMRRTEIENHASGRCDKAYIRWPFFLEADMIGLIGSIIPIGLVWSVYLWVYKGDCSSLDQL